MNSTGSKGSRSFVDRCVAYIGENALECMQTSSFLNLSREALIRLISSDNASLRSKALSLIPSAQFHKVQDSSEMEKRCAIVHYI